MFYYHDKGVSIFKKNKTKNVFTFSLSQFLELVLVLIVSVSCDRSYTFDFSSVLVNYEHGFNENIGSIITH